MHMGIAEKPLALAAFVNVVLAYMVTVATTLINMPEAKLGHVADSARDTTFTAHPLVAFCILTPIFSFPSVALTARHAILIC